MSDNLNAIEHRYFWQDYLALCKLKVVSLIVFTAVVGMLLAQKSFVALDILFFATLGIGLAAASAAVINHVVDEHIDALMLRTSQRPLPKGKLSAYQALLFAALLAITAMIILVVFINTLTAVLTMLALIGYSFIYSMYLKRATPQNIVIGGAAGAAPPVLGWSAVTNTIDPHSLLLFLIIFIWTPPHFWALAIYREDDYAKVNIPMLPVTHGAKFTRLQILLYMIFLIIVTILPYLFFMSGLFYLISALMLGGWFLFYTIKMQFDHSDKLAMRTFSVSIIYLMALFAVLLIDHYLFLLF